MTTPWQAANVSGTTVVNDIAGIATAVGVLFVGANLVVVRRQQGAAFEKSFSDRYEQVIGRIPIGLLLGEDELHDNELVERSFYDYFELCEEELYYRKSGRVSRATWRDWWEGIALNFRRRAFRTAWDRLKDRVNVTDSTSNRVRHEQFSLLRDAVDALDAGLSFDPKR